MACCLTVARDGFQNIQALGIKEQQTVLCVFKTEGKNPKKNTSWIGGENV
jgi:hypothetical protein